VPRVAVAQAGPVPGTAPATVEKAVGLIRRAAAGGAGLVLLPEAFVPGYPRGLDFATPVGARSAHGRDVYRVLVDSALDVPGPGTEALAAAARETGIVAAVGVVERTRTGTLYCSLLAFDPTGALLLHHRKLRPTGAERLMWGEGDGSTLTVRDTAVGRVGGLICWENYMPLARAALYAQGVEIYLAPTADARDTWQATLAHIACEGRCFVLGCNQFVPAEAGAESAACRGGSAIYGPLGQVLAGPVYGREEVLFADLDPDDLRRARFDFDATGHYARPDVFELRVNRTPRRAVAFTGDAN
jgi:nitrilase